MKKSAFVQTVARGDKGLGAPEWLERS